jgi:hypothetical protein
VLQRAKDDVETYITIVLDGSSRTPAPPGGLPVDSGR